MKRLQNTLYITTEGVYLHKERETLLVEQTVEGKKQKLMQVPIHAIESIYCFGNVMVSPQVMGFCGEKGTHLAFFDRFGRFYGRLMGRQSGNVLLRRAQFSLSGEQKTMLARHTVMAKIRSSLSVLLRHLRNHGDNDSLQKVVHRLRQILEMLKVQNDLDRIRGMEGESASLYFGVFSQLIRSGRSAMTFNSRTRRPPRDPVNAMLSFLYVIVGHDISGALQGVGLDPQVGFLHSERPGRDSLAQDILEEFRAFIVDRLVLTLINRQQVKADDFTRNAAGGVTMKDDIRKLLLQSYQAKKQEELLHPVVGEKIPTGLLPHIQAQLLARHIRGDLAFYPPFYQR